MDDDITATDAIIHLLQICDITLLHLKSLRCEVVNFVLRTPKAENRIVLLP